MTKEEIQASIKSIMFSGSVCGIEIYACLRDESGYQTKKIRATDKLLSSTKDKVAGFINCTYLADDAEFDTSENIADNKKEFYEISLIENYRPFIFLDDAEKRTEYYSESDRNKLSGFLFRINLNDKYFWVYQHIYSVSRIDRSKNVIALFVGDTYDEIDSDIVQIDSRADVIIFSSSVVTAKMDLMQRFFGFEQYIRAGAQKTIEIIRDLDIVDSLEKFVAFENKSKLTNWTQIMNECLNSGMNKTEWCRANGISDKQFFYWQRILRKEAFAASTSKDLSVITDPADETSPQKISFAEISIPIKQESVRNGFHPDIILRKGPVSVEISNSVSAELLSRIGDIFHAE